MVSFLSLMSNFSGLFFKLFMNILFLVCCCSIYFFLILLVSNSAFQLWYASEQIDYEKLQLKKDWWKFTAPINFYFLSEQIFQPFCFAFILFASPSSTFPFQRNLPLFLSEQRWRNLIEWKINAKYVGGPIWQWKFLNARLAKIPWFHQTRIKCNKIDEYRTNRILLRVLTRQLGVRKKRKCLKITIKVTQKKKEKKKTKWPSLNILWV